MTVSSLQRAAVAAAAAHCSLLPALRRRPAVRAAAAAEPEAAIGLRGAAAAAHSTAAATAAGDASVTPGAAAAAARASRAAVSAGTGGEAAAVAASKPGAAAVASGGRGGPPRSCQVSGTFRTAAGGDNIISSFLSFIREEGFCACLVPVPHLAASAAATAATQWLGGGVNIRPYTTVAAAAREMMLLSRNSRCTEVISPRFSIALYPQIGVPPVQPFDICQISGSRRRQQQERTLLHHRWRKQQQQQRQMQQRRIRVKLLSLAQLPLQNTSLTAEQRRTPQRAASSRVCPSSTSRFDVYARSTSSFTQHSAADAVTYDRKYIRSLKNRKGVSSCSCSPVPVSHSFIAETAAASPNSCEAARATVPHPAAFLISAASAAAAAAFSSTYASLAARAAASLSSAAGKCSAVSAGAAPRPAAAAATSHVASIESTCRATSFSSVVDPRSPSWSDESVGIIEARAAGAAHPVAHAESIGSTASSAAVAACPADAETVGTTTTCSAAAAARPAYRESIGVIAASAAVAADPRYTETLAPASQSSPLAAAVAAPAAAVAAPPAAALSTLPATALAAPPAAALATPGVRPLILEEDATAAADSSDTTVGDGTTKHKHLAIEYVPIVVVGAGLTGLTAAHAICTSAAGRTAAADWHERCLQRLPADSATVASAPVWDAAAASFSSAAAGAFPVSFAAHAGEATPSAAPLPPTIAAASLPEVSAQCPFSSSGVPSPDTPGACASSSAATAVAASPCILSPAAAAEKKREFGRSLVQVAPPTAAALHAKEGTITAAKEREKDATTANSTLDCTGAEAAVPLSEKKGGALLLHRNKEQQERIPAITPGSDGPYDVGVVPQPAVVLIAETREDRVGGCLYTRKCGDALVDCGANSFRLTPQAVAVLQELQLLPRLRLADPQLKRFICWEGAMHASPADSPLAFFSTRLLSLGGKLRLLAGLCGIFPPKSLWKLGRVCRRKAAALLRQATPNSTHTSNNDSSSNSSSRSSMQKKSPGWNLIYTGSRFYPQSNGCLDGNGVHTAKSHTISSLPVHALTPSTAADSSIATGPLGATSSSSAAPALLATAASSKAAAFLESGASSGAEDYLEAEAGLGAAASRAAGARAEAFSRAAASLEATVSTGAADPSGAGADSLKTAAPSGAADFLGTPTSSRATPSIQVASSFRAATPVKGAAAYLFSKAASSLSRAAPSATAASCLKTAPLPRAADSRPAAPASRGAAATSGAMPFTRAAAGPAPVPPPPPVAVVATSLRTAATLPAAPATSAEAAASFSAANTAYIGAAASPAAAPSAAASPAAAATENKRDFKKQHLDSKGWWEQWSRKHLDEKDESVEDFISRRLGWEMQQRVIDAVIAGVCAGNSRELSMRGSLPAAYFPLQHGVLFCACHSLWKSIKQVLFDRHLSSQVGKMSPLESAAPAAGAERDAAALRAAERKETDNLQNTDLQIPTTIANFDEGMSVLIEGLVQHLPLRVEQQSSPSSCRAGAAARPLNSRTAGGIAAAAAGRTAAQRPATGTVSLVTKAVQEHKEVAANKSRETPAAATGTAITSSKVRSSTTEDETAADNAQLPCLLRMGWSLQQIELLPASLPEHLLSPPPRKTFTSSSSLSSPPSSSLPSSLLRISHSSCRAPAGGTSPEEWGMSRIAPRHAEAHARLDTASHAVGGVTTPHDDAPSSPFSPSAIPRSAAVAAPVPSCIAALPSVPLSAAPHAVGTAAAAAADISAVPAIGTAAAPSSAPASAAPASGPSCRADCSTSSAASPAVNNVAATLDAAVSGIVQGRTLSRAAATALLPTAKTPGLAPRPRYLLRFVLKHKGTAAEERESQEEGIEEERYIIADNVLLTIPPAAAACGLSLLLPAELSKRLQNVPSASLVVVLLAYNKRLLLQHCSSTNNNDSIDSSSKSIDSNSIDGSSMTSSWIPSINLNSLISRYRRWRHAADVSERPSAAAASTEDLKHPLHHHADTDAPCCPSDRNSSSKVVSSSRNSSHRSGNREMLRSSNNSETLCSRSNRIDRQKDGSNNSKSSTSKCNKRSHWEDRILPLNTKEVKYFGYLIPAAERKQRHWHSLGCLLVSSVFEGRLRRPCQGEAREVEELAAVFLGGAQDGEKLLRMSDKELGCLAAVDLQRGLQQLHCSKNDNSSKRIIINRDASCSSSCKPAVTSQTYTETCNSIEKNSSSEEKNISSREKNCSTREDGDISSSSREDDNSSSSSQKPENGNTEDISEGLRLVHVQRWPNAIPLCNVGHDKLLHELSQALQQKLHQHEQQQQQRYKQQQLCSQEQQHLRQQEDRQGSSQHGADQQKLTEQQVEVLRKQMQIGDLKQHRCGKLGELIVDGPWTLLLTLQREEAMSTDTKQQLQHK